MWTDVGVNRPDVHMQGAGNGPTTGTPTAPKFRFPASEKKNPDLPAVVVVSLSRGPSQPERRQDAQEPHPDLHPAVLRGRERRGGEEEPGGRRGGMERGRAGRQRGRAERREGRRLIGEEGKRR